MSKLHTQHLLLLLFLRLLIKKITTATEVKALVKWKTSLTSSESLSSWSLSNATNLCHWTGVICDATGSVAKIILPNSTLTSTLNELDFASFANLIQLKIHLNLLVEMLPSNTSTLSKLTHLDLSGNNFTQPFPSSIGRLSELQDLQLYNNSLSGVIPY
ncbi:putative leucine-rich repeat receptor-like protein kinase [Cinnamomum micranthum f. kanehirae]|uniref:Putative leucine-rich repeat receptor-like protein kinase n=1 Tax=Cinnamomum micranthum f. kanehirae TaxID=337451 RepID=A0A3S3RAV1_9MAGN|nr:putative leucine-rich repeat receptor-like protein kinase [Cinnamomum micranthum f. kanehirae]